MFRMPNGKCAITAVALLLLASLASAAAASQPTDCGYDAGGPSLAHATASFKILDYECAARELDALLAGTSLTRPARADAYMLMGAVLYAQLEDDPGRDSRVTEQFVQAFRTFPQWRGEPHFPAAHYRSLIAEAKAAAALESGPMLASNTADPVVTAAGMPAAQPRPGGPFARGRWELGVALGAAAPTGDFKDIADGGFVFGLHAGYYATRQLAFGIKLCPYNFPGSADLVRYWRSFTGDERTDVSWAQTQVSGFAKYVLGSGHTSPYVQFQVGSYSIEEKVDAGSASISFASDSHVGFAGGGGIQFRGSGLLGGFAEVTAHAVPTDGSDVTFFDVRGGISFWLGALR